MAKKKRTPQQVGRYSRNKGKGGERELYKYLHSMGFTDAARTAQRRGDGVSDVECKHSLPNLHIEVKRFPLAARGVVLTKLLIAACEQAQKDSEGKQWVVMWRRDREKVWHLTHVDKVRKTLVGDDMIRMELHRLNGGNNGSRN